MVDTYRPATLAEALELRKQYDLIPFAGGTDLMVKNMSWSGTLPKFSKDVIFLSQLKELKTIEKKGESLVIGSGVTLSEVTGYPGVPDVLRDSVLSIAAPGIRNIATLAGNLCNASPAGDSICALYALDASVLLKSTDAEREVPVAEFITGPGRTVLKRNELVTAVVVPLKKANISVFKKVGTRKANALSKLSFTAVAEIKGVSIDGLSIAFGAVGPTVVRSVELEKKLTGKKLADIKTMADEIVQDYSTMIIPIDDQRSTAEYRKQVALNLLKNFLNNELLKGVQ